MAGDLHRGDQRLLSQHDAFAKHASLPQSVKAPSRFSFSLTSRSPLTHVSPFA